MARLSALEDGEPVADVLGVVGPRLGGDTEFGAQHGGTKLGDHFLHGVGIVAEPLAERAG